MKIVSPRDGFSHRAAIRSAAIEKKEAAYIPLACGHMTTYESVIFYSTWQVKGKYFCENCGRWVKKALRKADPPSQDEIPF